MKANRNFCLKPAKAQQEKELGVVTEHRTAVGLSKSEITHLKFVRKMNVIILKDIQQQFQRREGSTEELE